MAGAAEGEAGEQVSQQGLMSQQRDWKTLSCRCHGTPVPEHATQVPGAGMAGGGWVRSRMGSPPRQEMR